MSEQGALGHENKPARNLGLDLLKALLAVLILLRHTSLFSAVPAENSGVNLVSLSKFIYFSIQNLCVPVFLIISLNFYVEKRATKQGYFRTRVLRLLQIVAFWWPVYFLLTRFTDFPLVPDSWLGILLIPLLNGALYFLGALILCIIAIEGIERVIERVPLSRQRFVLALFLVCGFFISAILRTKLGQSSTLLASFIGLGPLTFIAYPAAISYYHYGESRKLSFFFLVLSALAFQVFEITRAFSLLGVTADIALKVCLLNYGSPIIIPLAIGIIEIFRSLKIKFLCAPISWIAKNCLGIYLVHPIIIAAGNKLTQNTFLFKGSRTWSSPNGGGRPRYQSIWTGNRSYSGICNCIRYEQDSFLEKVCPVIVCIGL